MRRINLKTPSPDSQTITEEPPEDQQTTDFTTDLAPDSSDSHPFDPSNPTPTTSDDEDTEDSPLIPELESKPSNDLPDPNHPSEFAEPNEADVRAALRGTREAAGGRPSKKPPQPMEETEKLILPTPPFRKYKSDAPHLNQRTTALWTWVNKLPEWVKNRATWYVYRDWPILVYFDNKEADKDRPKGQGRKLLDNTESERQRNYIDKTTVSGELAIREDTDLLNRYGCGNYRLVLNIQGAGAYLEAWVMNIGGGNMSDHPPTDRRINEPGNLDMYHPGNKSYLEFLRRIGKHPDQLAGQKGEQDVATIQAMEQMGKSLDAMAGKAFTLAEKMMENRPNGESEVLKVVAEESRELRKELNEERNERLRSLSEEMESLKEKASKGGVGGIVEVLPDIIALLEKIGIVGGGSKDEALRQELTEMRKELNEARNEELRSLRDEIKLLRTQPPAGGGATLIEQFKVFKDFRQMFRDEEDRENPVREAVGEAAGEMAPKWMRPYLPLVQAVVTGYLQARMPSQGQQPGMPGMPMPPPGMPPSPPQLQQAPPPPATGVNPGPGAAAPGSTPTPPTPQQQIHAFIGLIAPGISTHLQEGKSGLDFTDWFINGFGSPTYDEILGYGFTTETLKSTLLSHPALGPFLKTVEDGRVTKFVDEFLNYDSLVEKDSTATEPMKEGA